MCVVLFVSISCSCGFIRFLLCLLLWHFLSIAWLSAYRKTSFICAFCQPQAKTVPSPFPFPLWPNAPRTRSKFGASLSNYLYGIHNFCWWSFTQAASRWLTMAAWSAWTSVYGIEYLGCGIRVWVGLGWYGVGMLCGTVLQVALSLLHDWGHRWPAFRTLTRALKLSA